MAGQVIRIERVSPRAGAVEEPQFTEKGYKLGDPVHGNRKHYAQHAVYVKTLDNDAELIGKGFSLWMEAKGKRASLISPESLRIVRAS